MILNSIKSEYLRYKKLGEGAIEQIPDDKINKVYGEDNNSIAVIVYHISGNLKSRFTDFLKTDRASWQLGYGRTRHGVLHHFGERLHYLPQRQYRFHHGHEAVGRVV